MAGGRDDDEGEEDDGPGSERRFQCRQDRKGRPAEEDAHGRDEDLRRPYPRDGQNDPEESPRPHDAEQDPSRADLEKEGERGLRPGGEQEERGMDDAPWNQAD